MKIFVDASAYLSVLNKKDSNHERALKVSEELFLGGGEFVTSNIVIYEVYTVLSLRVDKKLALDFKEIIDRNQTEVVYLNKKLDSLAWDIFQKQTSKNVSFFDCSSFAVMRDWGIRAVFSFDSDFKSYAQKERVSFNRLP